MFFTHNSPNTHRLLLYPPNRIIIPAAILWFTYYINVFMYIQIKMEWGGLVWVRLTPLYSSAVYSVLVGPLVHTLYNTIRDEKPFPAHTTMLFSLNKTFIVCVILSLKRAHYLCKTSEAATENAITLVRNSKAKSLRAPYKGFIVYCALRRPTRMEQWQNSMRGCVLMWVFK